MIPFGVHEALIISRLLGFRLSMPNPGFQQGAGQKPWSCLLILVGVGSALDFIGLAQTKANRQELAVGTIAAVVIIRLLHLISKIRT